MIDGKDGMTRLRTHTLVLPVIAVLVGVVAALALLAVGSAQAPLSGMVFYQADLTGDQVVPPVATPDCDDPGPDGTVRPIMGLERANAGACGVFEAEGEEGGGEIRFRLEAQVPGITQAHIHLGGPAENGPVAAFLFGPADPAVDEIAVSGALTVDDLVGPVAGDWEAFIAGLFAGAYVQIHTEMNPAGALRGQIFVALPAPLAPEPTVGGELPPDPDRPPRLTRLVRRADCRQRAMGGWRTLIDELSVSRRYFRLWPDCSPRASSSLRSREGRASATNGGTPALG